MKFTDLHETIPYAKGGKEKILKYSPYPNITLALPGRHALDTVPIGGDFVVMVTDPIYPVPDHQFTHTDIFKQFEVLREKAFQSKSGDDLDVLKFYYDIILGEDPEKYTDNTWDCFDDVVGVININSLLYALQCLAVAEHRRYAKWENKYGGRYLPFRFAAGIAQGLWAAADAAAMQRKGRPGVEILEKLHGVPALTQSLMSNED
jgi:hypothetical protein